MEVGMLKKYWKILFIIFVVVLFLFIIPNSSSKLTIADLHEKNGAECKKLLEEYGLELSEVYQNDTQLAERSIKIIIDNIYENGLHSGIPYSYTEMEDLTKQVVYILEENNIE